VIPESQPRLEMPVVAVPALAAVQTRRALELATLIGPGAQHELRRRMPALFQLLGVGVPEIR